MDSVGYREVVRPSLLAVLGLGATIALSGCFVGSTTKPYPAAWPPLTIGASRPCEIAGLYATEEQLGGDADTHCTAGGPGDCSAWGPLVDVVEAGIEGFPHVAHTSLRIINGHDEKGAFIDVQAENASAVIRSTRLREGEHFRCTDEGIEITRGWYFVNVNVGVAFEKYRLVFSKDPHDGALVMYGFFQQRGLPLFVIPVWSSNDNWTRWQALANPRT